MAKNVSELELYMFSTRDPQEFTLICEKAYAFWKASWLETFASLKTDRHELHSDDFLDREVICLCDGGEPVALFFCNSFDVGRASLRDHSYFKNYPAEIKAAVAERGLGDVMVLSYMTLSPEWRTKLTDVPIPDLLFSIAVRKFADRPEDAILGYIRRDKSFSESFYRHGAEKIGSSSAYNVAVDFCVVTHETARISPIAGIAGTLDILWSRWSRRQSFQQTATARKQEAA